MKKKDECPKRKGNYGANVKRMKDYHSECKRCLEKEEFENKYRRNPVVKPRKGELVKEILERRAGNRKVKTGGLRVKKIKGSEGQPDRFRTIKKIPPTLKKLDDYNTY